MGKYSEKIRKNTSVIALAIITVNCGCLFSCGCSAIKEYSSQSLFPQNIGSIYVEMFDNSTFRRSVEYQLTDAVAKRIEAQSPYKIISRRNTAETLLTGQIVSIGEGVLTSERETGRALEKELIVTAVVSWKDLRTGQMLIDKQQISGSANYSQWMNQGFDYAATIAVNDLAQHIVELMENPW